VLQLASGRSICRASDSRDAPISVPPATSVAHGHLDPSSLGLCLPAVGVFAESLEQGALYVVGL